MILDVAEIMERRAKKRELRSKSLVYPPTVSRDRKDRDRRLTEINGATAVTASPPPSTTSSQIITDYRQSKANEGKRLVSKFVAHFHCFLSLRNSGIFYL